MSAEAGQPLTIGFRVKSGFAVAVALSGPAAHPTAIARTIVELSDPTSAETRQPYHSGFGAAEEDERAIARRVRVIERCAGQSIDALLAQPWCAGRAARRRIRAALVVGSVIDPARVGNQHIRAHANEGRLFRSVLADALKARGIASRVLVEKELPAVSTRELGRSSRDVKKMLGEFGKALGSPWRGEEKAAATAAWLALL